MAQSKEQRAAATAARTAAARAAAAKSRGDGITGDAPATPRPNEVEVSRNPKSHAGAKITVACKVPNGLRLRLFKLQEANEQVLGGGSRSFKRAEQVGEEVVLYGPAFRFGQVPNFLIVGGYALTPNVDADFFREWLKQNPDLDAVKNHLVFAQKSESDARAEAKEKAPILSGLQPMDMRKVMRRGREVVADLRMPKPMSANVEPLETADLQN